MALLRLGCALFGASLMTGCATIAAKTASGAAPGTSQVIAAGERELGFGRTYRLHVPPGVEPLGRSGQASVEPRRPLVVALHGGIATARIFEKQTGFSELADRAGFLVVYPNGIGIFGLLRHWNAGWCCAKAMRSGIDDVGFIDRVIDQVVAEWPVDRDRIYVVGYSNGGMLAHGYAAVRSEKIAGLAVFAGPAGLHASGGEGDRRPAVLPAAPAHPLPVLVVHGRADRRLAYDGGGEDRRGFRPLGAIESAELWARSNGCAESAVDVASRGDESGVERLAFCADSATPVEVLLLDDWGHEWPGPRRTGRLPADRPLAGFDAARSMWQFFDSQ